MILHNSVISQNIVYDYSALKCATPIHIEYENSEVNLNFSEHSEINDYHLFNSIKSVESQIYYSRSGIFQLNYETTGVNSVPLHDNDMNGTPDYIEQIAEYFDYSLNLLADSLGFTAPLIYNKKYQIEFRNIFAAGGTIKDLDDERYTKIILNNDLIEFGKKCGNTKDSMGVAKVTAAHELKHAVQYVYNRWRDKSWFLELDATWFEDYAFDDVDNYLSYLTASHITSPGSSFSNGMGYGNSIWMHYLTQTYGLQINREIWESSAKVSTPFNDNTINDIINEVLMKFGSTLESAITEYFVWNYFSGANYSSKIKTYKDARLYPTPNSCSIISEPSSSGLQYGRQKLSADFIKFREKAVDYPFEIKLVFENSKNNFVLIIKYSDNSYDIKHLEQVSDSVYYRHEARLKNIDEIILIPIGISSTSDNYNYSYRISPAIYDNDYSVPFISIYNNNEQLNTAGFPSFISAEIIDESGIDTAYIEYRFDNSNLTNTKLNKLENNTYGGYITLDSVQAKNVKELYYRIIAVDSSVSRNVSYYPIEGYSNIKIDDGLSITSIQQNDKMLTEFKLFQNYPNPFNPSTIIRYALPEECKVIVRVFNLLGQEVQTLFSGIQRAGFHKHEFNANQLASGIYFYSVNAESNNGDKQYSEVKKMLLAK